MFISILLFGESLLSQTIKFQSFEGGTDDWGYTANPAPYNVSGDVWDIVTTVGGTVTSPQDGTYFWGMRDLDNNNGGGNFDHTLTFDAVDISASSNVQISFYYISDGFDGSDYLKYQVFYGDAGSEVGQGEVELDKNTDAWTQVTISIPNSANSAYLILYAKQNGGSDYAGWDNIKIESTVATDSDAEASDTGSQPAAGNISSVNNADSNNPVDVFNMDIYDWATSDGLPTHVTNIRIKPKNTNTADWTDNIQGVVVDDGSVYITPSSVDITDAYIDMHFNSGDLDVADNSTRRVNIAIYLNTSNIEDGKILSFMVDVDDHGFTADPSGTQFAATFSGGDFYSNDFTIDVEATEMQYQQQPTNVEVNTVMTPAVTVAYTDINGNVDVDYDGLGQTATLSATGSSLAGTTTTAGIPVLGIMTFDDIEFTTEAVGVVLTVTDDGNITNTTVTSNSFDVTPAAAPICHEEHFDDDVPDGWTNNGTAKDSSPSHYGDAANCRALGDGSGGSGTDIFTPSFDYPEQLEFYQDASGGGDGETATLEYRIGNSGSWTSLYSFSVTTAGNTETVDLTNVNGVDLSAEQDVFIKFLSSFNTWYLDDVVIRGGSCTLGVELVDFKVKKQNSYSKIYWATSSELNNDYFSLEWSTDGKEFKEIAQIKSKGNHRKNQEYSYIHKSPAQGTNYYRLTQYDLDGRSQTFDIVSIVFDMGKQNMIIAPNKVVNNLRIEFSQPVEKGSLLIYNMEGRMIQSNILANGIDMINLDVSGLPSGQYIAKYIDIKGAQTEKFVKL